MSNSPSKSGGIVTGNSQNVPSAVTPRTRSTFPLHYHFFNTHRFGECIPHYWADMNKDEDFPIHSTHDLRSYTLKSPLMQNVKRNKDYFLVPMEAILPLNWEKFFDNPVRGDDVTDDVGCGVADFWKIVGTSYSALLTEYNAILATSGITDAEVALATFRLMIIGEYFYSNGNLLASLGCHGLPYISLFKGTVNRSYDYFFDTMIGIISNFIGSDGYFVLNVDGFNYTVSNGNQHYVGETPISMHHALQLMRDNPFFNISSIVQQSGSSAVLANKFTTELALWTTISPQLAEVPCNLERLWAYQLSVSHFMSNDHIDYIYSAELFRQLIGNYIASYTGSSFRTIFFFTRNGIQYQYDYLSAKGTSLILSGLGSSSLVNNILLSTSSLDAAAVLGYVSALFGYRRSLRYLDYFTGSRAQPLAVVSSSMNTNVAVNANQVSVIDITRSIQAQRFLNSVNRIRHNFEGYLKGVFGGELPAPDYHNPFYLAHTDDVVFGSEVENTGVDQLTKGVSTTTSLHSHSGRYMFDIHTDRPCIAIGITSYDIPRVYYRSTERGFFYLNRFDYFNPFMQYSGDQPLYLQELGISPSYGALNSMSNFAYSLRHMEYKQRFNQAAGGFCENLPGWLFLSSDQRGSQSSINPDWIRSLNAEFDRFYVSLTGFSLGSYWHFIVDDYNSCNGSRPMAYAPQILG